MRTALPFLHQDRGRGACSRRALVLSCAAATALLPWSAAVRAGTVLDPANPSNFMTDGTQTVSLGAVLTLTDQSVGDRITLFANDTDASAGTDIDLVATFQFTHVAPANVNANNRLAIHDGTHAAVAQCLVMPGAIRGIGLYAGGSVTDSASYPVFVPVDWMSAPVSVRLRRWANGDAELLEVNGVAPNPRALLAADLAPPTWRGATSVEFGLGSFEARATVEYSEFRSFKWRVFADGFEGANDCAWGPRQGSSHVCDVTVDAIQRGEASGEVRVVSAVVTAFTADFKHLWIADYPTSGIWKGIYVDRGSEATPLGASIIEGSEVQVRGTTDEDGAGTAPNSLTRIVATEEPLDQGFLAEPVPLFSLPHYLSDLSGGEPYEGILVQVDNVTAGATLAGNRVELDDLGDPGGILLMDDASFLYGPIAAGSSFACVRGVMHLDVDLGVRLLLPRSAADLITNPALCPTD